MNFKTRLAISALRRGGIVSLPTDTIQGLSCLPKFSQTLEDLVLLKQRSAAKGLILLSSDKYYFSDFVEDVNLLNKIQISTTPTTYLIKASQHTNPLLTGEFNTIALRLTSNNLVKSICESTGSALVSTSANRSGKDCANSLLGLRIAFKQQLDFVIAPKSGDNRASKIVNCHTGERLR